MRTHPVCFSCEYRMHQVGLNATHSYNLDYISKAIITISLVDKKEEKEAIIKIIVSKTFFIYCVFSAKKSITL